MSSRPQTFPYTEAYHCVEQSLDLYEIKNPRALLVFIHGGAWISEDKNEFKSLCQFFANQHLSVAAINYRLSGKNRSIRHPTHVMDCSLALRWLRTRFSHASPMLPLFLMGHSAGAHLAALLAMDEQYQAPPIQGVIGVEGVYDLNALAQRWPAYVDWFIKHAFGDDTQKWISASPQSLEAKRNQKFLLVHSPQDELVDLEQTLQFHDHLLKTGARSQLFTAIEGKHQEVIVQFERFSSVVVDFIFRSL